MIRDGGPRAWGLAAALVTASAMSACGRAPDTGSPAAATNSPQPLSGRIAIDGSSTMLPLVNALVERFLRSNPGVVVAASASTTAAGFKKLCEGQLDIAAASRPINAAEMASCREHRIEFIELPIAFDSLSVVVNAENAFVDCLTVAELKKIWEPAAQGRVMRWSDVRPGFPARSLTLVGPGSASGTFDYFTLAIVGEQGRSRNDYTKSDDDTALAEAVVRDPNALGYFGYALYQAHHTRLKAVAVDGGQGCVSPSVATVAEESYRPLARPVFLYASASAAARPEVAALARFAISPENTIVMQAAGYVPLPVVASLIAGKHVASNRTGSIFGGRGAVLGVAAETFMDDERVRNELVR